MKQIATITMALALTLGVINASDVPTVTPNTDTPTFGFDSGGFVKTSDFDNSRSGIFVGVHGYPKPFADNLGLFAEGRFYDTHGTFLDEAFGGLLFSVHEGKRASLSLYIATGANFEGENVGHLDRNDILIGAGIRWDAQLWDSPFYIGAKAGWEKQLLAEADHQAIGAAFLSAKW